VEVDGESVTVRALLDTGAPFTLLDRGTGDALGVDFRARGARRRWHRVGGDRRLAQIESVRLSLRPFDEEWWDAEVGFFVDDWGMPFAGLLGQDGFFDRWVVTFNRYDNYFVVEERDAFIERFDPDQLDRLVEEAERRDQGWRY
jgi:hypothetical protein